MMNVLVIGGGGREHALAWKLAQSPWVNRVFVTPGNGGTDCRWQVADGRLPASHGAGLLPGKMCNLQAEIDSRSLQSQIQNLKSSIHLTIVGPEAPLAAGIVDALQAAGLRCFGPVQAAARLEASKAFAKDFMARHGIPTARYAAFTTYPEALAHLCSLDYPPVIKASGLAAGKGVIVPATRDEAKAALRQIMLDRVFGPAGDEVIIEERLEGQEASVLAFCDGQTIAPMPAAQDHKRVFDGDRGPNTGGMGAYAPALLVTSALMAEIMRTVLQPTVDGLAAEAAPYVGVLYAGLMLTQAGPRVLEFNCRFGDPETQAILPLLESDLVDVMEACLAGQLHRLDVRWRAGAAATVVAASEGYPGAYPKGRAITGIEAAERLPGIVVFHAGTRYMAFDSFDPAQDRPLDPAGGGRLVTDGGRVLAVTGIGDDLRQALDRAYAGMACIHFEGMHFRRDIGTKA